jgi:hypothetical protein
MSRTPAQQFALLSIRHRKKILQDDPELKLDRVQRMLFSVLEDFATTKDEIMVEMVVIALQLRIQERATELVSGKELHVPYDLKQALLKLQAFGEVIKTRSEEKTFSQEDHQKGVELLVRHFLNRKQMAKLDEVAKTQNQMESQIAKDSPEFLQNVLHKAF